VAAVPTFQVDDLIDDQYKVIKHLGSGSNGQVYRVLDEHLQFEVALKLLNPKPGQAKDWREAQALQRLRSEFILRVYNAAVIPGIDIRYLTTALADNGDCDSATGQHGVPVRLAMRWCQQASSGLARVHDDGLLHRDIKPANVFLSSFDLKNGDGG